MLVGLRCLRCSSAVEMPPDRLQIDGIGRSPLCLLTHSERSCNLMNGTRFSRPSESIA